MSHSHGDLVEVIRLSSSHTAAYHSAIVLRSPANQTSQLFVEYQTLMSDERELITGKRLKEYVDLAYVRPMPPVEVNQCFKVGDYVDAFCEIAWLRGTVMDVYENSRYLVLFDDDGEEIEFEVGNLRLHREWNDGIWDPPFCEEQKQKKSSKTDVAKSKSVKLKITYRKATSVTKFKSGATVEVRSDEEGYQGSWYSAIIIDSIGSEKYLVEYLTLKTDDEAEFLREEANRQDIRPSPPALPPVVQFNELDEVDAWYNEGWWVGVISKVLHDLNYIVYFKTTNENLILGHSNLRPHQDWINGKWVIASKKPNEFETQSREQKLKMEDDGRKSKTIFSKRMKVEVRSDEEGYQGSWYSAVIVDSIGNDKFLVEYQTLKTDDETECLKELANASHIRPCPADIQRVYRFSLLEKVDAWYNDGWWVGHISKVHDGLKYTVYFRSTNEELEFEHSNLRPHQEWIDGRWVARSGE